MTSASLKRTGLRVLSIIALAAVAECAAAQDFEAPRLLSNTVVPSDRGWDQFPDIAADGAGNWVAVWQSDENLNGTAGTDDDIFVARSSDDGATWSPPALLNSNGTSDDEADEQPRIVTDGAGTWIAAWTSRSYAADPTDDYDILYARSTDNGATWSPVDAINSTAATDSDGDEHPSLATDGAGNWVAVWESVSYSGSGEYDILVARSSNNGLTWSAQTVLQPIVGDDGYPDVATDGGGHWVAVWRSYTPGGPLGNDSDIMVSRSTNAGATWTLPAALGSNAATDSVSDTRPQIATDGTGVWVTTWMTRDPIDGDDNDIVFARSTDNGSSWSALATVATDAAGDVSDDDFPAIAYDSAGSWAIAWHSRYSYEDAEVRVARSTNGGVSWLPAEFLNTNAADDDGWDEFPRIASDGAGGWVAVWRSGSTLDWTIGNDDDVFFARSQDAAATWSGPAPLNINATSDRGSDEQPQIVMDSSGRGMAVWASYDDLHGGGGDEDILFSRTADRGVTWSAPAALNTNAAADGDRDFSPDVATDGAGTWMAVWSTGYGPTSLFVSVSHDNGTTWSAPHMIRADGSDPRLATDGKGTWVVLSSEYDGGIASDVSDDGGATWESASLPNASSGSKPEIATDSDGTWIAVWNDNVSTPSDIFSATSTNDGATWTSPILLTGDSADTASHDPEIATDGAGTWVVVWTGENFPADSHVRFKRSVDSGKTWSAIADLNTLAIEGAGIDHSPSLHTDGNGTWLAAWDTYGQYAERHDLVLARSSDGAATWSSPGILSSETHDNVLLNAEVRLADDGAGNWVAVWPSTDRLGGQASGGVADIFVALGAVCGDEFLGVHESCGADLCNDADPCTVDDWEAGPGCSHAPAYVDPASCFVAPQSSVGIRYSENPGRSRLTWSWKSGEAFTQSDLGGPILPRYALCVYDMTGSTPSLAASLVLSRDKSRWTDRSPRGLQYKAREGDPSGVNKLAIKTGEDSRTKISIKAGGNSLSLPGAVGASYFTQDPAVVLQLVHSGGSCWSSSFGPDDTTGNDESGFSAKTR